jgi:hypothetical protein
MGDEPKGFHKQFAGMDNGHRGRQKGQKSVIKSSFALLFTLWFHSLVQLR